MSLFDTFPSTKVRYVIFWGYHMKLRWFWLCGIFHTRHHLVSIHLQWQVWTARCPVRFSTGNKLCRILTVLHKREHINEGTDFLVVHHLSCKPMTFPSSNFLFSFSLCPPFYFLRSLFPLLILSPSPFQSVFFLLFLFFIFTSISLFHSPIFSFYT